MTEQFGVDAVLDTGDITDWGSSPENRLIGSVGTLGVPYVYIRGNHDSGATAALIAAQPNAIVLDDSATTVAGLSDRRDAGSPLHPRQEHRGRRRRRRRARGDRRGAGRVRRGSLPEPPAIALVHDPGRPGPGRRRPAGPGRAHPRAEVTELEDGTLLMVQGSTGGAGLRGLQGEYPEPLTCTVLYLDPDTGELRAYDEITLGGLGETEVTIQRTVLPPRADEPRAGRRRRRAARRPPPRPDDRTALRSGPCPRCRAPSASPPASSPAAWSSRRWPAAPSARTTSRARRAPARDPVRGRRRGRDPRDDGDVRRVQDGRASLGVAGASVSCAEGESVGAGPLQLECTSVTDDAVEITASLG